ncbi:putative cytochrome P450 [Tricladium varicosporioides]|nr:putative cytochrome P450 [Hymenoscyphus varicosporioides]
MEAIAHFNTISAFQGLALSAIIAFLAASLLSVFSGIYIPPNLPRIREPKGNFSFSIRTRLAYYNDAKALFQEIYDKYGKVGKTVLMPGLGQRCEFILPNSSLKWLTSQTQNILNNHESLLELDQFEYTRGWVCLPLVLPVGTHIGSLDINTNLDNLASGLNEEVENAIDSWFGNDTKEWKEISVLHDVRFIVAQVSGYLTVGKPLCRNEKYQSAIINYGELFVINAGLMGSLPKRLRPLLAPLAALPIRYYLLRIKQQFKPQFEQRMKLLQTQLQDQPIDHLQKMLQYALKNRPTELNHYELSIRVAVSHFGASHQTSISMSNILLNILDSDPEYNTISILRQEIAQFRAAGGVWSKSSLAKMVQLDSIIRETLRLHSFGNRGLMRRVMVDNLWTEDGILLPKHADVSILAYPAHTDPNSFVDPLKFDPFRFARLREKVALQGENGSSLSFVSTGATNLQFGHGRQACPGRFPLDFMLKMMIAYILTNYDVEFPEAYNGRRPETIWKAEAQFVPSGAKVLVKRRTETS